MGKAEVERDVVDESGDADGLPGRRHEDADYAGDEYEQALRSPALVHGLSTLKNGALRSPLQFAADSRRRQLYF